MTVSHVPLSQIEIDPVNVRRTNVEPTDEFTASIFARGVEQPLLVRLNGGKDSFKTYEGGKRLRSLWKARDEKISINGVLVTSEYPVPVLIKDLTDEQARDASLATNVHREDMHPVDKFEAFSDLIAGGDTAHAIAARYGVSVKEIERSLALGALSPKIRDAWRKGDIDAAAAKAFTLAKDHESQDKAFKKVGRNVGAWHIRHAIIGENQDAGRLLKFVGRKEYEAAGGAVIEDLFADERREETAVTDMKLLTKLADKKLADKCTALKAEGWSWAETREEAGHNTWNWTQLPGGKKQSPENMAKSGCLVELKHDGTLEIRYAMQKPSQQKKAKTAAAKANDEPIEATISGAMTHRLSCALTVAAAKAIESEPALALTVAIAALLSYEGGCRLRNSGMGAGELDGDEEFADVFKRIAKMPPKEQSAMFAKIVGASLDFQTHNPERDPLDDDASAICDAIDAKRMNTALREVFDPKDYFGGVSKAIIAQAVTEAMGKDHGAKVLKMKTGEAAAFAIANVPKTKWLPEQLRVAGYDGPGAKKAPAKKTAKKKAV